MPIFDYSNKVVLITGVGAVGEGYGNGSAMAAAMAKQGATIFGCDINLDAANHAVKQISNEDEVKAKGNTVETFQQQTVRTQKSRNTAYV